MPNHETRLFVFFGLIASGKSTLATAWAKRVGGVYYNSDRVRKELVGIDPKTRRSEGFGGGIYSKEFSRKTYDALLERATGDLSRGCQVVLDASYQAKADRDEVRSLAQRLGVKVVFIHCICGEEEVRSRLEKRVRDPLAVSDGRWEVYLIQRERFEEPDELPEGLGVTIDTEAPIERLLINLEEMLATR